MTAQGNCVDSFLHVSYSLILDYPSLKRKPFLQPTKKNHMSSVFGCVQYGHGSRICCRTRISFNTLCGMLAKCQSLMNSQHLGSDSMMNHGQQTDSGKFRYVPSILYYPT
jgi:hypothetical protein